MPLSYSQNLAWSSVYVLHEIVGNLSDQLVEIVLDRDKRGDVAHRVTWELGRRGPRSPRPTELAKMCHFAGCAVTAEGASLPRERVSLLTEGEGDR
jgi:hypothetical protein